ncbi:MAG TPA: CofH family radical SAM protein [Phycisphaerae bacterium]|nr:CofH family radical SAM protein [Phycisphaerae bacterium]
MIAPINSRSELNSIAERVEAGQRLSFEDGVALFASRDIHEIGRLANLVRERLHGDAAYYNVNRHINYSNLCVLRCKFCSFYRPYPTNGVLSRSPVVTTMGEHGGLSLPMAGDASGDAYEWNVDQIVAQASEAYRAGATEVHIVGGLHPKLPFSYYVEMCRALRAACPRMHIKAFTAIEIIHFTRITKPRMSIREVLEALRDAGLGSLPGGGAEIFDDRVHDEAYKNKVGEEGWFDVHRVAHEIGMYTNATMLYGHVERSEERVRHMIKLREHQDESLASRRAAFNCFIPLSFIPEGSELSNLPGPTGLDDLKTMAISRLMLDNFPHIKAFWIMQSAKLAQVALNWGVDDLDGTVVFYDITKREGGAGNTHQEMTVERMQRLIREAGRRPVERDTLYRTVVREGADWRLE